MRTYVIGNEDCVLGFSLVGVEGIIVRDAAELKNALNACHNDKTIGLLLVTADVAIWAREQVDALKVGSLSPLIVEIPGEVEGTTYPSLQEFVQRAVGISLGGN
jgi:V/A-type H+/Na+-transporting ATPase subunit F